MARRVYLVLDLEDSCDESCDPLTHEGRICIATAVDACLGDWAKPVTVYGSINDLPSPRAFDDLEQQVLTNLVEEFGAPEIATRAYEIATQFEET